MRMPKASLTQQKAIDYGMGPVAVLAGPGSGKTFTVISRICHLILNQNIPPDKILCITFTKAAALEMEQRFLSMSESEQTDKNESQVFFGTVHSLCYQILKESGQFKGFRLVSDSQKVEIVKHILISEIQNNEIGTDFVLDVLSYISRRKNNLKATFDERLTKEKCDRIFDRYGSMLKERKSLDFDDMIEQAYHLLKVDEKERRKWQTRISYLLVDEFQDLNQIQYQVICLLAGGHKNLFAVGDDDQSIYGFRGAAPNLFRTFFEDYPKCGKIYLTDNYRSGHKIVAFADDMIRENHNRIEKKMSAMRKGGSVSFYFRETRKEQETALIKHIKALSITERENSAVLLRTNREVVLYEALLSGNQIQTVHLKQKNKDLLHHFVMEDYCAYLRFLKEGGLRSDFLTIYNKPEQYLERAALNGRIVSEQEILRYYQGNKEMQMRVVRLFRQFRTASELSPYLAIKYFRQVIGYDKYLLQGGSVADYQQNKKKADEIMELFRNMKPKETVHDFLIKTETETGTDKKNQEYTKGVKVMTMHGAKGLEFNHVFLPDLNEGIIPPKNCKEKEQLEEERRLLYVAITRAKESLYLYYTAERNRKPCRFLKKQLTGHQ